MKFNIDDYLDKEKTNQLVALFDRKGKLPVITNIWFKADTDSETEVILGSSSIEPDEYDDNKFLYILELNIGKYKLHTTTLKPPRRILVRKRKPEYSNSCSDWFINGFYPIYLIHRELRKNRHSLMTLLDKVTGEFKSQRYWHMVISTRGLLLRHIIRMAIYADYFGSVDFTDEQMTKSIETFFNDFPEMEQYKDKVISDIHGVDVTLLVPDNKLSPSWHFNINHLKGRWAMSYLKPSKSIGG